MSSVMAPLVVGEYPPLPQNLNPTLSDGSNAPLRLRLKTAEGGNAFGLRRGGLLIGRKQGRRRSSGHRFSERDCFIPKFILHTGVGESHRFTQSDDFFHTMGRYPMYSSETLGLGPSRAFF